MGDKDGALQVFRAIRALGVRVFPWMISEQGIPRCPTFTVFNSDKIKIDQSFVLQPKPEIKVASIIRHRCAGTQSWDEHACGGHWRPKGSLQK